MLPLVDVGQHANGVIAIGQVATGVVAIGQSAHGVIAIGQIARGVIAVGMVGVGVVSFGMLAIGVVWAGGMAGVGGRAGLGFVLPLAPVPNRRYAYPRTTSLAALGKTALSGWLKVQLVYEDGVVFLHRGRRMNRQRLTIEPSLVAAATAFSRQRGWAFAKFQAHETGLVCKRIVEVAPSQLRTGWFWLTAAGRVLLLIAVCVGFWVAVGVPLGDALLGAAAR